MRNKLLLSTAALLAGMSLASAQHMPGGQTSGNSSAQEHQQSTQGRIGQAQPNAQQQNRQSQSQRSEGRSQHEQTTGQATKGEQGKQMQHEQNAQGKPAQTTGQGGKEKSTQTQHEQGQQAQQPGRNERDQAKGQKNQPQTQGQAGQPQQGQQSQRQQAQPKQAQPQQQGQAQQPTPTGPSSAAAPAGSGSAQAGSDYRRQQTQAGGNVTLTEQQRTQIRTTVLARSDAPRLNTVNFALTAGTIVPNSVHVVAVPETLIAINPEWREDMYFVVRDDIVIVDHSHRIVALVPVGSAGAQASAQGSSMALNLSRDEIRQVQIMLNEKGFNVGEPDGVLGERTRSALMQFQQRQGFHASGQIDQQTMAALGVSKGGGQQGQQGQPSSTGQGGSKMNQPSANQGNAAGQKGSQGAAQPSTAGQGSQPSQQPSANPPAAKQGPGTTGQSSGKIQQNMNPNAGTSAAPERHGK